MKNASNKLDNLDYVENTIRSAKTIGENVAISNDYIENKIRINSDN